MGGSFTVLAEHTVLAPDLDDFRTGARANAWNRSGT